MPLSIVSMGIIFQPAQHSCKEVGIFYISPLDYLPDGSILRNFIIGLLSSLRECLSALNPAHYTPPLRKPGDRRHTYRKEECSDGYRRQTILENGSNG